ncbi:MAG: NAD-dependent epimerase/dehydratase family protein [Myxococcales bacterium]|nr:NAD-dependent epimerase/dehydratase family protein [Myxococcales bacterium]
MPIKRRLVLRASLAASLASLAALAGCRTRPSEGGSAGPEASGGASRPSPSAGEGAGGAPESDAKTLLILGGTGFLGPHIVEAAQARGYTVTLFNRGKTNPHLFPDVEKLRGDRKEDLGELAAAVKAGRRWRAVIDTSGYVPRHVRESATLLAAAADHYIFISSISVYAEVGKVGLDEGDAVGELDDPSVEEVTGETYGPLKALCEAAAEAAMPGRTANVRPGLIVGPGDPTDRFTYWPVRVARGGPMIAPGAPTDPVQYIDARDLATWLIECAEARHVGIFNAVGPATPTTIGALIDACRAGTGGAPEPIWIDADFLAAHEVAPWMELTVWVPPQSEEGGLTQVKIDRALAAGLAFRPLQETAADTLAWWQTLPEERRAKPRAGLDPAKEEAVLAAWRAAKGGKGKAKKKPERRASIERQAEWASFA